MKNWMRGIVVVFMFCLSGMSCAAEELTNLTFDSFLTDLSNALNERYHMVETIQFDKETSKQAAVDAVECEWNIMSKYENTLFKDASGEMTNEEYIRTEYMKGLKLQKDSQKAETTDEFWIEWDNGYRTRANVLEELNHVYYDRFSESDRAGLNAVFVKTEEITGGFIENHTPVAYQIQALLNATLDGEPGKRTVFLLKQTQKELGLEINGVINQKCLKDLVNALAGSGKVDVIEAANASLKTRYDENATVNDEGILYEYEELTLAIPETMLASEDQTEEDTNSESEVQLEETTDSESEEISDAKENGNTGALITKKSSETESETTQSGRE